MADEDKRSEDGSLVMLQRPGSLVEVHTQCETIEAWADECESIPDLQDANNKLAAIDEYLNRTTTEGRARVAATMRRLEVRIGELDRPQQGRRTDLQPPDHDQEVDLDDHTRSDFRAMAADPETVEQVISQSTDDDPPSRRKVTRAIKLNKPKLGTDGLSHPARFNSALIKAFRYVLVREWGTLHAPGSRILDPFAGTGLIHELYPEFDTTGVEIEPEWAALHERTRVGNALELRFPDDSFDAIVTSPCYGNRLADSHDASDPESRRSYTHDLGRELRPDNAGSLHWRNGGRGSEEYRRFHEIAWAEAVRVLRPSGIFILNIKDHWRDGKLMPVGNWHTWCLGRLGLIYLDSLTLDTGGLRSGANAELRSVEEVYVFSAP